MKKKTICMDFPGCKEYVSIVIVDKEPFQHIQQLHRDCKTVSLMIHRRSLSVFLLHIISVYNCLIRQVYDEPKDNLDL